MSLLKKHRIHSEDAFETQTITEAVFRPAEILRFHDTGLFDINGDITSIQDMTLWHMSTQSGYRTRYGCSLQHQIEIHFVETGTFKFTASEEEIEAGAGTAVLLKDTRRVEIVARPGSSKLAFLVPFEQVAPHLHRGYGSLGRGLGAFQSHIGPDTPGIEIIQRIASHLLQGFDPAEASSQDHAASALIHDALIMMFVSLWPKSDAKADEGSALPRHLERAIDWLDRHADQEVSVEQLARRSGASIRTLQNSFRHHLSTTPNAYILQTRLSRVHDELLNGSGDETIEGIASRWGFRHMGYFAARYRALYGESPSDTRRERRGGE
ncbi:AraC family transcriptional regulator [Rhizobium sp. AG855]|uniref:helix-turn-helix transcriptional regulator n=1 Tax=Rhizobium sp. AG855 TaxID=2183898 RepID=UPI000E769BA4|nr:helix-turn-helix protein [Rhizobium sp. AG855]